jgi:cytosine/adenosine deaminase-related metal-dependent hydrolase
MRAGVWLHLNGLQFVWMLRNLIRRNFSKMMSYGTLEMQSKNVILGSIVHSLSFGETELIENGMIVYSNNGIIDQVVDLDKTAFDRKLLPQFRSVVDNTGKLIMPGFVDAHCHAPQYVFTGTGMDLPLLAWLEKYTFPCEARFGDINFARAAYEKSIRRHLKCGTTFAAYFATIHNSGGKVLVDIINKVGQRAFVGKVSMDRNSPDFYIEETVRGCQDAEEFARYVLSMTPIGATYLAAVDNNATLTTATLLAQSRNSANRPPSLSRGNSTTNSSAGARDANGVTPTASGTKRPRSVSTGDDDESFFAQRAPGSSAGLSNSTPGGSVSWNDLASAGETPQGKPSASSNSNNISSAADTSSPRQVDSSRPSGPARPRAISDMEMYGGFEEDEYYQSGDFQPPAPRFPRISGSNMGPPSAPPSANKYAGLSNGSNGAGAYITATAQDSDTAVTTLLNKAYTPLVLPCITPRFVPTCTGDMLAALGRIAAKYGLPVQSHLSESVNEIAWVKELHPECENYASVYQKYGLLNEHCIMAHCCHSDAAERQLLAHTGTSIVHCASSNFSLDSGVLDVHGCIDQGIKVGLGTDVAGGYSPSMLDALRQSIIASKVILFDSRGDLGSHKSFTTPASAAGTDSAAIAVPAETAMDVTTPPAVEAPSVPAVNSASELDSATAVAVSTAASSAPGETNILGESVIIPVATPASKTRRTRTLSYKEAFHLATVGGACALGMGDVVGNFLPGKKLDCLVIDPAVRNGPFDCFDGEGPSEWFQKFLFLGDDRNIVSVFVDGRQVI